jgi:phenylacetate-coenzyme A ligase PaaK-like adenylate-forming protein
MNNTLELALKQTKDMETQLPLHLQALTWSKEKIKEIRQQRLKDLLAYAKKHSPWYKEQLAHIDPENFTEEMLSDLPTINKTILMENWDKVVTNPDLSLSLVESHIDKMSHDNNLLFLLNRYRLMITSGSSGHRGIFVYDWNEWNTYYLMFKRYRFYNNDRSATLLNPMKKIVIGAIIGTNAIHSIYSLEKSYKTRNTNVFHFPITAPMNEIIDGLNQTQPDVLLGSSSTIHKLSKEAEKNRLKISPTVISVYGEPFYPPMRQAIEKTWSNAGIFNTFGTSEGFSASYCRANSKEMHLNDDLCIIEPVDATGNSIKKGIFSKKIYLTNLFNHTLPLIRYEIPDELQLIEKTCICGSHYQLMSEPQNRPEFDFTYTGDIFVNHVIFAYPLLSDKNIKEYQVIQTKNGANIKILTAGDVNLEKIRNTLVEKLTALGLSEPIIHFVAVSEFNYPASGKLRRFIPLPI